MVFTDNVKFLGTYRPYQQRVLDNLVAFLDNEKIHVVAAPGSGKTILGLELIVRLNNSSLILTPSIAIREQWIDRFSKGFLKNPEDKDKWISNDLKVKKPIICITYQSFYSAFKKEIVTSNEDEEEVELQDYSSFDLLETLNKYNIKTICLDECHHLKSEWWKALESIIKKVNNASLIALTATPPYDSSNSEWQRYISLCGPIDEEIFIPELIKDNSLCPHQDYVYFSYPTKEEEKGILKFYANGIKVFNKYKNNPKFIEIVSSNKIYLDFKEYRKAFYENEKYYRALALFLHENHIKLPFMVRKLAHIEKFNINHLEVLLQHVLFDDMNSYVKSDLITSMKKEFSALGVVHSRKVNIVHDERLNKVFSLSLSKLESIKTIVSSEYNVLKEDLKCLILADYIKLKNKGYIGSNKPIDSFGTIPIFEYLRRANINGVKLCCLSGTICIIPTYCKQYLSDFEFNELPVNDFVEVVVNVSNRKLIVLKITELLQKGLINTLIGTKSLLGEGWDSPCINSLIMASFVGSYVLSNQMRGRAIRSDKDNINKKSNVWHLVCLNPFDYQYSYDYYNLEKRFSSFIGLNVEKETIENGIDRLGFYRVPYNKIEADNKNLKTIKQSQDRELIKRKWECSIEKSTNLSNVTKITSITRRRLMKEHSFYNAFIILLLTLVVLNADYGLYLSFVSIGILPIFSFYITIAILLGFIVLMAYNLYYFFNLINPESKLKTIGKATLNSLVESGHITSKKIKVKTYRKNNTSNIYLANATTYEQNIFSDCIKQVFAPISQPRYMLTKPKIFYATEYYVVPEMFKKNKDTVSIFYKYMSRKMGAFHTVFAKNATGKLLVLHAEILYNLKYKKVEIETKNILLTKKEKTKK